MEQIKFFKKEDREKVIEFNRLVHDDGVVLAVNNIMFNNPFNSLKDFVYIEEDGKILSMVGLLRSKQRFGNNEVEVGEIALVGTHPEHRKRGLCLKLMNYWEQYMKENNIPLCFLFGIPNFYQQFGFEYAVPVHFYNYLTIDKEMLKNAMGKYEVEELEPENEDYIIQIKRLYDEGSKMNFCSRVRSLEYLKHGIEHSSFGAHRWYIVKEDNIVKGYMWLTNSEKEVTIREAVILNEEAALSLCELLYSLTKDKEGIKIIGMKSALNNSFARFLYKKGGRFSCNNEIYPGSWAGMYKIVDLMAAMNILRESFEERLKESKFYDFNGRYRIVTDAGAVGLSINKSKVEICDEVSDAVDIRIPLNILTSVYTGYRDIAYYKEELSFHNKGDFQLFNVLFPLGNPYIWDLEMSDELE